MYFYGKTDVGMRRSVNQDNFMVRAFDTMVLAAVVCDGMGGANGGNVASSLAGGGQKGKSCHRIGRNGKSGDK